MASGTRQAPPSRSERAWNAGALAGTLLIVLIIGLVGRVEAERRGYLSESLLVGKLQDVFGAGPGRRVEGGPSGRPALSLEALAGLEADLLAQPLDPKEAEALFKRLYAPPLETAAGIPRPDKDRTAASAAAEGVSGNRPRPVITVPVLTEESGGIAVLPVPAEDPVQAIAPPPPSPEAKAAVVPEVPVWRQNSVAVAPTSDRPVIAVVMDDLGLNRPGAWRSIALPGPLTLAFMTYAPGLKGLTKSAREHGHELLVHMPMEPQDPDQDAGRNVLEVGLSDREILRRLRWGLGRFDGFVGINNHMGSRFTERWDLMALVMGELKQRGLMYLDSRTSESSAGALAAQQLGVPHATRDVFIDNDRHDPAAIRAQLAEVEAVARQQGFAVAIGHPHANTLSALEKWLPSLAAKGFDLVPVSALVELTQNRPLRSAEAANTGHHTH